MSFPGRIGARPIKTKFSFALFTRSHDVFETMDGIGSSTKIAVVIILYNSPLGMNYINMLITRLCLI